MACDICTRPFAGKRKPLCASCVQATLYIPRIEQASALLSREKAHIHAEAVLRPGNDGVLAALPEDADLDAIQAGVTTDSARRARDERQAIDARILDVASKAEELKQQITQYKAFVAKQKEDIAKRTKDIATSRKDLQERHVQALEPVHLATKKAKHRLNKSHAKMVEAREVISKEAGILGGLKKTRGKDGRSTFWLGGLPIPDLKDIHGCNGRLRMDDSTLPADSKRLIEPHDLVSASLDNVCRFLGLFCNYLSIRLPAEIILPFNETIHSAILPLDSSYKPRNQPPDSVSGSETAAVLRPTPLSRPRPLHLDRPYPQLLKENPKAAAFFREGVVLLAYNISWLCKTQGVETGTSFDDICAIGRRLYELIPRGDGKKARPNLFRNLTAATDKTNDPTPPAETGQPRFGTHSHGSLLHSLAGHEGQKLFGPTSSWDVSITKLTDQLRSHLRRETARAEWDFIETTEWDSEREDERPVFVGGMQRRSLDAKGVAMSVMTVKPSDDVPFSAETGERGKGWMKVRDRGADG